MKMIGYTRVSTDGQAVHGYGLAAQRRAIRAYAEDRGWDIQWMTDAGRSAKDLRRPGIERALRTLEAGKADGLVVAKLDRLSRSLHDFTSLVELSQRQDWSVACVDPDIDLTTPIGEMVASVVVAVAQWERHMISARIVEAMVEVRARGVRLGSPVRVSVEVAERIHRERGAGLGVDAIAKRLNADGVPTVRGGGWWIPATVRRIANRPVREPDAAALPTDPDRTGAQLLTDRQLTVAAMRVRGMSVDVIAARLGLARGTTQQYLERAYERLGIHSYRQLAQFDLAEEQTARVKRAAVRERERRTIAARTPATRRYRTGPNTTPDRATARVTPGASSTRRRPRNDRTSMIGYCRVSTAAQADTGYGLEAQHRAIATYARAHDWQIEWVTDAGISARTMHRPGLEGALQALKMHDADGIVVAKLDRLSRSLNDFARLAELSRKQGWSLVCLQPRIDLTTPSGEMVVNVIAAIAQWERRIIGQRVSEGLAEAKARGVRWGLPVRTPLAISRRIHQERDAGRNYSQIANGLNADRIPPPRGGLWWTDNSIRSIASRPVMRPHAPPLPRDPALHGVDLLTPRQRDVATLAAKGVPIEVIAARLGLSTNTVYRYLCFCYRKLGIHSRTELRQFGLVERRPG